MIALPVLAEARKVASTRLWWGLLVPLVLLSALVNLFGAAFTTGFPEVEELPVLLGSAAYALSFTSVFAVVHGVVAAAGEHRHRTITTTYLTTPGRWRVLLAKMLVSAVVGAGYAAATAVVGVLAGLVAGARLPEVAPLLATTAIGLAVAALWGALGAAFGTAVSNQVGALVAVLLHLLIGELLVGALLSGAGSATLRGLAAYLPGNAGDAAIYDVPADAILGPATGDRAVEVLAGVSGAPPWPAALAVLAAWTAAAGAVGWVVGGRRDIR